MGGHQSHIEERRIAVGADEVGARVYHASSPAARVALVLGHGAGAPHAHPFMVHAAESLAARGIEVLTFNFLYMERQRGVPDRNERLEACFASAVDYARRAFRGHAIAAGGKSMGGRIASQAAAKGALGALRALVFLGYPLHPPNQPQELRAAHLPDVRAPMLFIQGARDPFGTPDELRPFLARLDAKLIAVEHADHSLKVGKRVPDPLPTIFDSIARFLRVPHSFE